MAAGAATALLLTLTQVPSSAAEPTATAAAGESTPGGDTPAPRAYDEVSVAAREAKETGQRVELESRRGSNTTEFVNPDGTSTVEITQNDTRVEQDGEYIDIDPSLEKAGGVLVPEASKADVEISDGSGSEPLATVSRGSKSLSLDWTTTDLSPARVDGAEATFDAGANRDVRVTATANGFNVNIVLDKVPTSAPIYRLPVTAKGVRLVATTGGGFAAKDASDKVVFRIAPPLMWDSSQTTFEAGPENTVPVAARVVDNADDTQTIELRPDFGWLSSPDRVTPIFVDPDVYVDNLGQQGTYVSSTYPNTAYPTSSMNRVGLSSTHGKTRTYWQPNLPARVGGRVVSASLRLYEYGAVTCNATPVTIYPIGSYWDANTATWNNRPESLTGSLYKFNTQPFAHGVEGQCGNAYETIEKDPSKTGDAAFALKNLVEAWMSDTIPYFGMTLMGSDTDPATYKGICSYVVNEGGTSCFTANPIRQPTLTITYNTPPTKAFNTSQSPVTCYDGDAPRVTSLSPTLTATADDVDVWHRNAGEWVPTDDSTENVRLKFEVWPQRAVEYADPNVVPTDDPDGPLAMTATGYSSYVQRNTPASWTVPAAKLVEGEEYVWRAIAEDGTATSPYWSDWTIFSVNTAEAPGVNCPVRLLGNGTAEVAATELQALVDADLTRYYRASYDDATGVVSLAVARVAGRTDASVIADARTAARARLDASTALTTEQITAVKDSLAVYVVDYSTAALAEVQTGLAARVETDSRFQDVTGFGEGLVGQDRARNVIVVGTTNPTAALQTALTELYGARAVAELDQDADDSADHPFNDNGTHYGGMALSVVGGGIANSCTANVVVDKVNNYLQRTEYGVLTSGHCGLLDSRVYNRSCTNQQKDFLGTITRRKKDTEGDWAVVTGSTSYAARMWTGEGSVVGCETEQNALRFGNKQLKVGKVATRDPMNGKVCKWGARTGHMCGSLTIRKLNVTSKSSKDGNLYGLVRVTAMDGSRACNEGDSGGPVYTVIQDGDRQGQIHINGIITRCSKDGGKNMYYIPIQKVIADTGYSPTIYGQKSLY